MTYAVEVREVVSLWVEVEADSKSEARAKAGCASEWRDWQEVPDVLQLWVPRAAAAECVS